MMKKLDIDDKLEQDDFEGVDEDEWVSWNVQILITTQIKLFIKPFFR